MHGINHDEKTTILHAPSSSTLERIATYRVRIETLGTLEHRLRIPPRLRKKSAYWFARQSELMRGHVPPGRSQWTDDRLDRKYRQFKVHVAIAEACLCSHATEIMHPSIINDELHGNSETQWRDGTIMAMRIIQPRGELSEMLSDRWLALASSGISQLAQRPESDRIAFAWMMHDLFICIQPFKSANERTGRLLLQLLRQRLGLLPIMIRAKDMMFHESRLDYFRWNLFLPLMRRYGYL